MYLSVSKIYSYVGTWSILFDVLKVKQLIAIKNGIKKRNLFILIFFKLRLDFVSKNVKIGHLFAVYGHDGKELEMFLIN